MMLSMPTIDTTPMRLSPPTATATATATSTGTGSRSKTAYATHLVRMSRAIRTMAEKANAPVVERIHDLREEVKAMLAASAAYANDDEGTLFPGASTSTSHGPSGSDYAAKLKTHAVALAFETSLAGAKHRQNVRSLSEELERAAQCIVQSDAHSAMLAKRLDARAREVVALRRALARVQQQSAAAASGSSPSETVSAAVPALTQVTEDTSTTNGVQDDKDDAVDYKRQCVVLRADLESQCKTHARALSQALQRTMAMETLLTQARAAMAEAVSRSSTTTVDGDEADVEDDSADEHAATVTSTSLATASATTVKTFERGAAPSVVPSTTGESTPTSDSESPVQESSPGAVDAADPLVFVAAQEPAQERGDSAIAESPTSAVPPETNGSRPSRIPPPTVRIPPSLMRTSLQTRLPVTSASGSTRGLRWPGWAMARGAEVANGTAANVTAIRASPAAAPTVAAARTTTAAAPAKKSSAVRMASAVKQAKKKAQRSAPKPKTSATKAAQNLLVTGASALPSARVSG